MFSTRFGMQVVNCCEGCVSKPSDCWPVNGPEVTICAEAAPASEVPTEEDAAKPGKKKREKTAKADSPSAAADERPAKKRDKKSAQAKGEPRDKT